jgi:hypothetical protein
LFAATLKTPVSTISDDKVSKSYWPDKVAQMKGLGYHVISAREFLERVPLCRNSPMMVPLWVSLKNLPLVTNNELKRQLVIDEDENCTLDIYSIGGNTVSVTFTINKAIEEYLVKTNARTESKVYNVLGPHANGRRSSSSQEGNRIFTEAATERVPRTIREVAGIETSVHHIPTAIVEATLIRLAEPTVPVDKDKGCRANNKIQFQ